MFMTAVQLTWCSTGHLIVVFIVLNVTYCTRDTSRFQQNSTFVTKNIVYLQNYWIRKKRKHLQNYIGVFAPSHYKISGGDPNNVFLRGFYRQPIRVIGPPGTNYVFFTCYQSLPLDVLIWLFNLILKSTQYDWLLVFRVKGYNTSLQKSIQKKVSVKHITCIFQR